MTAPHRWQWAVPISHSDQICVDWVFQRRGATSPPWLPFLSQWGSQVLSSYSSKGLLKVRRDHASPGHGSLRKFPWQCLDCDPEVVWHPHLASFVATPPPQFTVCAMPLRAHRRNKALLLCPSSCLTFSMSGPSRSLQDPSPVSATGPSWLPITLPQPSAGCSELFPVP